MNNSDHTELPENYCGRILSGKFSDELKRRVSELCHLFNNMNDIGSPAMLYLSAWKEDEKIIWYEHIDRQFATLLGCNCLQAPECLRNAIIDWRVYRYDDRINPEIHEEILTREELRSVRSGLRKEVEKKGSVEAIYKIARPDGTICWLKDQASVETFSRDGICLSLGTLTDVSKEMAQKDLLEKIGFFDELTKLPKRNILHRILEINLGQYERKHIDDFSFLMMDIDYFKSVNDTYGHQAGDHVLATLAEVMISCKRKEDEIGRYGGEEFYGVCIGNIRSSIEFAERLREKIAACPFEYHEQNIPVTISIGVAAASEFVKVEMDQLIKLSDQRLYSAKEQGRNCVVGS